MGWDPYLGDTRLLDEVEKVSASPLLIVGRLAWLDAMFGEATRKAVLAALPPLERQRVEGARGTVEKAPMRTFIELDRAILAHAFAGKIERFTELGEYNAERSLSTVHRAFLWLAGNPLIVFRRLIKAYPKYYAPGEMRLDDDTPGRSEASLDGILPFHFCTHASRAWMKRAVELAGAKHVSLTHHECRHRGAARCRWRAEWS